MCTAATEYRILRARGAVVVRDRSFRFRFAASLAADGTVRTHNKRRRFLVSQAAGSHPDVYERSQFIYNIIFARGMRRHETKYTSRRCLCSITTGPCDSAYTALCESVPPSSNAALGACK